MNKIMTVVIPAYNMEKYLSKGCGSILEGNKYLDRLEVLIVNDGSWDTTLDIARQIEARYQSVVRAIDKPNGNYGSAINRGLKEAAGTYIKILDADDSFDTNGFNRLMECLISLADEHKRVDLVITNMITVDGQDNVLKQKSFDLPTTGTFDISLLKNACRNLTHHCATYRTALLKEMGYEQLENYLYTDQEWVTLPLLTVASAAYLSVCVYRYLLGREGQTMEKATFYDNYWMQIDIKKHMLHFYDRFKVGHAIRPENQRLFETRILGDTISIYRVYIVKHSDRTDISELLKYDSYLKETYQDLYVAAGRAVYAKKLPLHFIKWWRKDTPVSRMKCMLLRKSYIYAKAARDMLRSMTTGYGN